MNIQCDCGKFKAELTGMPSHTPGRLACYCDDCQNFLIKIGRESILDAYGGTEIIPVYPSEFKILQGREFLKCNRLSQKGLNRWTTSCCNSPVGNTKANFPWVGIIHSAYRAADPQALESLGPIKSRIMGKYKKGNPPFEVSDKLKPKDALVVLPFILKGLILKKNKNSPFFDKDGKTPSAQITIL